MNVWLVTPAFGRFRVTRMVLAQRAHLAAELAGRGVTCRTVVVADDENLEIAREYGCETIEMGNDFLGARVNAGFELAGEHGADYVAFIGSDDWLHQDLFDALFANVKVPEPLFAGHHIAVVDLERGLLRRLGVRGANGVPPWFFPRWALEKCGWAPCEGGRKSGIEGSMGRTLRAAKADCEWVFNDPHDLARVDFKCGENMTSYDAVAHTLGFGAEVSPWDPLLEHYPADVVERAKEVHLSMWLAAA